MALMDAMDSRVEELTLGNVDMADLLGRYDGRQVSEGGVIRSHHEEKPPWRRSVAVGQDQELGVRDVRNIIVLRRK